MFQMCGIFPFGAFAFAALYKVWTVSSGYSYTPLTHPSPTNIRTLHPCSLTPFPDISGQFKITTGTKLHQQTFPDNQKSSPQMCGGSC